MVTAAPLTTGPQGIYISLFFGNWGGDVSVLHVNTRQDACAQAEETLEKATGIFFTGGPAAPDQYLRWYPGGSSPAQSIPEGAIIAGTSAGALCHSETMIVDGEKLRLPQKYVQMAPGLGLLQGMVVDQHFAQRGWEAACCCGPVSLCSGSGDR